MLPGGNEFKLTFLAEYKMNPPFNWRYPETYSIEYLRMIHRIVEDELRRRNEEKVMSNQ